MVYPMVMILQWEIGQDDRMHIMSETKARGGTKNNDDGNGGQGTELERMCCNANYRNSYINQLVLKFCAFGHLVNLKRYVFSNILYR
jgi:hypothetical protein